MNSLAKATEAAKQKRFVELLAAETNHPVEEVRPVYNDVYARLKDTAEIQDFVPVFAWRRALALLKQQ